GATREERRMAVVRPTKRSTGARSSKDRRASVAKAKARPRASVAKAKTRPRTEPVARGRAAAAPASRQKGAAARSRYVYFFGNGTADGRADMKNLLGGKGANLAEMAGLGLPVPPGFTITTEVCTYYYANGHQYPPQLRAAVAAHLAKIAAARRPPF